MNKSLIHRYWVIVVREMREIVSRPLYLGMLVGMPVLMIFFFLSLMWSGVPTDLPVATVDNDNSATSRSVIRTLDGMKSNAVVVHAKDFAEARHMMQTGEVYGIYYIPKGFEEKLQAYRQPTVSFYTNNAYMIPSSLLMSDMKTASVLTKAAVGQSVMKAKGYSDEIIMGMLQPISIDTYQIGNSSTNYIVYLCSTMVPGLIDIIIMLMTIFVLGKEVKDQKSRTLMRIADNNILLATIAKLTPITLISFAVITVYDVFLYSYMEVPCKCGVFSWMLVSYLYILSSQALAIFFYTLFPTMRMSLSIASLFSVLSISMSGLTFPVSAMPSILQGWSLVFPLRYFHLLYIDLGLNGNHLYYCWPYLVGLMVFLLLPTLVLGGGGLKKIFNEMKYTS